MSDLSFYIYELHSRPVLNVSLMKVFFFFLVLSKKKTIIVVEET